MKILFLGYKENQIIDFLNENNDVVVWNDRVDSEFVSQFDFVIKDVGSKWDNKYACLHDLEHEGYDQVRVRYSKLRKICIIELEDLWELITP